jgi:hypothetical protein
MPSQSKFEGIDFSQIPVERLTQGAGRHLVEWAIEYVVSEIVPVVGVRFVTVDALYDYLR